MALTRGQPTARKAAEVAELKQMVATTTLAISAQYRGLSVAEMTALRRRLRDAGVEVRVVKNTLLRLAAQQAERPGIADLALGPTAFLFSNGDIAKAAKSVQDYVRTARNTFAVQGSWVEGQVIMGPEGVADLASLPSKDQLLAGFMGGLRSPIAAFASLMSATIQQFASLVDARANQLEEAA